MKPGWFGPKRYGWGISPTSWQGWAVTLVLIAGLAAVTRFAGPAVAEETGLPMPVVTGGFVVAWLLVLLGVIALTYDSGKDRTS